MLSLNLPRIERFVRIVLGLGLAAYAWIGPERPSLIFGAMGLCLAMTGLVGFCPACALAGRRLKPRG